MQKKEWLHDISMLDEEWQQACIQKRKIDIGILKTVAQVESINYTIKHLFQAKGLQKISYK